MHIPEPVIAGVSRKFQFSPEQKTIELRGEVRQLLGLSVEAYGPPASVGDLVMIKSDRSPGVLAEVTGFRDNRVMLMPLQGLDGIRCGDSVVRQTTGFQIQVSEHLLGRVFNGLLQPLDGMPPVLSATRWPIRRPPPDSLSRPRIRDSFHTGVRAIDAGLPCGCGQRVGIFSGSGVGKSSLLGMICRYSSADVNVVALIGERGKEVREFIEESLGPDGLRKSVVVVVTSDQPALQRIKGAEVAMAVAEFFREQNLNVLLVMDSVTRYAMGQREIGLASGEPPTTKGYPPSVFALLPQLLERAGTSRRGSITAFFTVLVEGDDLDEPITDTVRSIVDGHIVLSRQLANQGHYPPVDLLASVSRVIDNVAEPGHVQMAHQLRNALAVYRRNEDLINIGAYTPGTSQEIDRVISLKPKLDEFLRQPVSHCAAWSETFTKLQEIFAAL